MAAAHAARARTRHRPGAPNQLAASSERVLVSSADTGRTWRPVPSDLAGRLAWPHADALCLVDANGTVMRSADGGREFSAVGTVGSQPEGFAANGARELSAAVHGGTVLSSADGGGQWRTRSTP